MKGVLVSEINQGCFVPVLEASGQDAGDICIGVFDEETDTACGIMATDAIPGKNLLIRYIYVHPDYRRRGAGRTMVSLLSDIAASGTMNSIRCKRDLEGDSDEVVSFFEALNFSRDDPQKVTLYTLEVSDLKKTRSPAFKGRIETVSSLSLRTWSNFDKMLEFPFPWRSAIDPELSFIASGADLAPKGILFTRREGDAHRICGFYVTGADPTVTAEALFEHAISAARTRLSPHDPIFVEIRNEDEAHNLFRLSGDRALPAGQVVSLNYRIH